MHLQNYMEVFGFASYKSKSSRFFMHSCPMSKAFEVLFAFNFHVLLLKILVSSNFTS